MTAPAAAARSQDVPATGQDYRIHNSYTQQGEKFGVKASTSYYSDSGNSVTYLTPTDAKGQATLEKDKRLVAVEKEGNKVFIPRQDVATHQKYHPSAVPAKTPSFQGASPDKALQGTMSGKPKTVMMASAHGKTAVADRGKITGFKDMGGANRMVANKTKTALGKVFDREGSAFPNNSKVNVSYKVKANGKIDSVELTSLDGKLKPEQVVALQQAAQKEMSGLQLDLKGLDKKTAPLAFPIRQFFTSTYVRQEP